jgi:hypothetical protein
MRETLKNVFRKEIFLEDGTHYSYTVQPYEMKNALGAVVAVLDEYSFTRINSLETYKLYRTVEGNWYEISKLENSTEKDIIRMIKNAFLQQTETVKSRDKKGAYNSPSSAKE